MKYRVLVLALGLSGCGLFVSGCATFGEARDIDPTTGRIKTHSIYGQVTATVLKSETVDMGKYRPMILVLGNRFIYEQTVKFGFFGQVFDKETLEKKLIDEGKTDVVSEVGSLISWKKIADNSQPFLVLKPEIRRDGRDQYFQLRVYAADTASEVFTSEVEIDYMWKGTSDDVLFYPLYNSFIDWARAQPITGR